MKIYLVKHIEFKSKKWVFESNYDIIRVRFQTITKIVGCISEFREAESDPRRPEVV